jgi:hypothetical protein
MKLEKWNPHNQRLENKGVVAGKVWLVESSGESAAGAERAQSTERAKKEIIRKRRHRTSKNAARNLVAPLKQVEYIWRLCGMGRDRGS